MIYNIWKLFLVGNCPTFVSFALVCMKWEIEAVEKMRPKLLGFLYILRFWSSIKWAFQSWNTRLYTPLCRSVRRSVGLSVGLSVRHTLLFLGFCGLWPDCSCPSDQVTSNTAPAHPHATEVAVYPALLYVRPNNIRANARTTQQGSCVDR